MGIAENEADSTIPTWINSEFLEEILTRDLKKNISVTNANVKRAVPKGENYLSVLYRAVVEYKENKTNDTDKCSLIIKSLPEGELMQKFLSEMKGLLKESCMYTDILPEMNSIIESAKGTIHPLSARCLPCARENVIVMEDLKHLGYKMAMRKQGLDLDHCKFSLRALARFHAASIALYKRDPSFVDTYDEGVYKHHNDEEQLKKSRTHMKNEIGNLASTVETWPGYEKYGEKLRKIGLTAWDNMVENVNPKKYSLNVLNHGDYWVNNILFRYSPGTGAVEDVRFVDFQIARYSSPALDLQYFLCHCPNDEVRFQHRDTLLEEYHSELSDYCKAMNLHSELISLQQLKEEFEEKDYFGLITACTVLCIILAEADDMPDSRGLKEEDGDSFTKGAQSGKRYREIFQKLLVFYEEKGLL